MIQFVVKLWNKVPPPMQRWLKGAEVAVVGGVLTGAATLPTADFHSKEGIAKFVTAVLLVAGASLRLYMAQSPLQTVILQEESEKISTPAGTLESSKTTVSQ